MISMDKRSDQYVKSSYEFGIYGDEKSTYVKEEINVKGRDEGAVRRTAEALERMR